MPGEKEVAPQLRRVTAFAAEIGSAIEEAALLAALGVSPDADDTRACEDSCERRLVNSI